ncbi:hypothetical protein WS67_05620 [Burkholderia singularis]|uniref:Uncharacterized protein n=1 Tax=Burkholderia singularis TaxID=1503053 RepID=A0A103E6S8_9BURK|nr:DUF6670 family protein [Burkholderia singularis]KVE29430.1 hypothetical protein WS67_05620 [Burkholderia singularis]
MDTLFDTRDFLAPPSPPLIDSRRRPHGLRGLRSHLMGKAAELLLRPVKPSVRPAPPAPLIFPPNGGSCRFGLTHYGVTISNLPDPHQFLACRAIIGNAGMRAFDTDFAAQPGDGPLRTATLVHGTAAAVDGHFTRYSIPQDVELRDDGSLLRFGNELLLAGRYPDFQLKSRRAGFAVDLRLHATGDITWLAKGPLFDHIVLVTRYRGRIEHEGTSIGVAGLCTYEYARGSSPYLLYNRFLPKAAKLPWDVLSYHVIDLDAETQLLLSHVQFDGHPATYAHLRILGECAHRLDADVHFRVLSLQSEPAVAPDGSTMPLPRQFIWTLRDTQGNDLFVIEGTVDTPMLFGVGTGYVGGYRWEGMRGAEPISGRGYIEYVDQRR